MESNYEDLGAFYLGRRYTALVLLLTFVAGLILVLVDGAGLHDQEKRSRTSDRPPQVPLPEDDHAIERFSTNAPDDLSACALRLGLLAGSRTGFTPRSSRSA